MEWSGNLFRKVEFREISGINWNRKNSALRYVTRNIPEYRNIPEKIRFLFRNLEKFPCFIPKSGKIPISIP